ncbi:MAG: YafY family transcriptional regulator [Actinomycetota bacterium]|nr:YafY family transcriptional regulator [Actinomycetota bacterium]
MNRTDRLYALVEDLRATAPRSQTAAQLAQRYEVSVRTIERDLSALQQTGVPIFATPGRRGGYAVDETMTLPPVNFTASEATAIAVALAQPGATPFATAGRTALQKILSAMGTPGADAARALTARFALLARADDVPPPPPAVAVASVLEEAIARRMVVTTTYVDRHGALTERDLEPHAFVGRDRRWYLVAWCRLRRGARSFRLDRLLTAELTGDAAPDRSEAMNAAGDFGPYEYRPVIAE